MADERAHPAAKAHQGAARASLALPFLQHPLEKAPVLLLQLYHQRKGGVDREPLGYRGVDPSAHGVEERIGERPSDATVAEALQRFVARRGPGRHEDLGGDAQLVRKAEQLRPEKGDWCFRQPMQTVGEDVANTSGVAARQQEALCSTVFDKFEGVGLVGEKPVAATFEQESIDVLGAHRSANVVALLVKHYAAISPQLLDVESGCETADAAADHSDRHRQPLRTEDQDRAADNAEP